MPNKPPVGKEKIGGVSLKWWLIGGVATGGVAYLYYRHNAAKSSAATLAATSVGADPNAIDPNAVDPNAYSYDAYGYGGGGGLGGGVGAGPSGTSVPSDNMQWLQDAIASLTSQGYDTQHAVSSVTALLSGQPVYTDQLNAIESAIGQVGHPPVPPPPVNHLPVVAPRPAVATPQTGYGYHPVVKGNTTQGIASEYGLTMEQLRAYNPTFNFGAPLMAGEVLKVRSV